MDSIIGFLEFLIGAVIALVALFLVFLLIASRLSPDNPLRQVLNLLLVRLGVTAAAGALAIPIEPIPGIDVLYDIGAPLVVIYCWYTFFRRIVPIWSKRPDQRPRYRLTASASGQGPTRP